MSILNKAIKQEQINTNNAWGFGGTRGTKYYFDKNVTLVLGKAGTRHQGEFAHTTVRWDGVKVCDYSGHKIDLAAKWVESILNGTIKVTKQPNGSTTYEI